MTAFDSSLVPSGDILIGGEWRRGRRAGATPHKNKPRTQKKTKNKNTPPPPPPPTPAS
ncbi:hypothetical protein GSH05_22105, partial [Burkholderia pseudomallei]|nr:hypothetical protein [Burkholderia pseudomallei]